MKKNEIRPGGIVEYLWIFKREFEEQTGKSVYWSLTLGDLKGKICTVVTLGVDDEFIQVKVKNGWKNNRGIARAKVLFRKTFVLVPEMVV